MPHRLQIGIRSSDRITPIATAVALWLVSTSAMAFDEIHLSEPHPVEIPREAPVRAEPPPEVPRNEPTNQYGKIPKGEPTNQYGNIPKGEPTSQYGKIPKGEPTNQYGNIPKGEPSAGDVPKNTAGSTGRPDQSQYQDIPKGSSPAKSQYADPNSIKPSQPYQGVVDQAGLDKLNADAERIPKQAGPGRSQYQDVPNGTKPRTPYSDPSAIKPSQSYQGVVDQNGLDKLNADAERIPKQTGPDRSQYQEIPPPQRSANGPADRQYQDITPPQRGANGPAERQYQDITPPNRSANGPDRSQYQDLPKGSAPGTQPRNQYANLPDGKPRNLYDLMIPKASEPYAGVLDQAGLDELNAEAKSGVPKFKEIELAPPKSTTEPYANRPTIRKLAKWKAFSISPGDVATIK